MFRTITSIAAAVVLAVTIFSFANASVVYRDIDDLSVPTFEWLDVDGNGTADIAFDWYYDNWYDETTAGALLPVGAPAGNGFAASSGAALKLEAGDTIDASLTYAADSTMLCEYWDDWEWTYLRWGNWDHMATEESAFLGFTFTGAGSQIYYGWVRAHVSPDTLYLTVYDYAYESEAGMAITAGDTGSPVPLPAGIWLFGSGIAALLGMARKQKRTV